MARESLFQTIAQYEILRNRFQCQNNNYKHIFNIQNGQVSNKGL